MKVVVDTNVVISALLKESRARLNLIYKRIDFYAPDYLLDEMNTHKEEIIEKNELLSGKLEKILGIILKRVKIINKEEWGKFEIDAKQIIGKVDEKDIPFVAVYLYVGADFIYTFDKDFSHCGLKTTTKL